MGRHRRVNNTMRKLIEGHARFRESYWLHHKNRFSALAREGQRPYAMVVACSDSRVTPEVIFDCVPGEIFVVRNVSNLVPPYAPDTGNHGTSAALEFAVTELDVKAIIVLGHSQCGGIRTLMEGPKASHGDFINSWMQIAKVARKAVHEASDLTMEFGELCYRCELASIQVSLANLLTFPWIRSRIANNALSISGLHFNVETGELEIMDSLEGDNGEFKIPHWLQS